MKESVYKKAVAFKAVNDLTLKGEIVIYGSTYMANFPFYELINKSKLENAVYNRSIEGMTLDEALELLPDCVFSIRPAKIFLSLGEGESSDPSSAKKYEKIVNTVKTVMPETKLYLIEIDEEERDGAEFNKNIEALCDNKKVKFIKFTRGKASGVAQYRARFAQLSKFFRDMPITFADAFAIANI